MKKNKNRLTGVALAVLTLSGVAHQANAELYVSPVVRKTVQFDELNKAKQKHPQQQAEVKTLSGQSSVHGDFVMKEQAEEVNTMRFGDNVPFFIAIEKVVPNSSDWAIHFESGLENMPVSWKGGDSWEDVVDVIAQQNDVTIIMNHEEQAIGIAKSSGLAVHLAKEIPSIWKLEPSLSLRENLSAWATKAGWHLEWDQDLKFDYPVQHGAILTGEFVGEGGVVDKVLYSMRNHEKPLTAKFHTMNKVVFVTEAGFRQEVMY